jgi:YndJ-like protein
MTLRSGTVLWAGCAVATMLGAGHLTLTLLIVLLAPMVIVPMSVPLLATDLPKSVSRALTLGAITAGLSALPAPGTLAGALASGWLVAAAGPVARHARATWKHRTMSAERVVGLLSLAWLPAAAAWLVASRFGATPFGFGEPITLLTSAHFHIAGHATTALAATVLGALASHPRGIRRLASVAVACTTIGPFFVAAGWQTAVGELHVIGATLLSVGLAALGVSTFAATKFSENRRARRQARIGACVPAAPLAAALLYSVGRVVAIPTPSIAFMVRAHGMVNAVGFATLSIFAWTALRATNSVTRPEELVDVVIA